MHFSVQKHCIQFSVVFIYIISVVSTLFKVCKSVLPFSQGMPMRTHTRQQLAMWGMDKNGSITRNHSSTFSSPLTCIQSLNASLWRSAKYKHYSQLSTQTGPL